MFTVQRLFLVGEYFFGRADMLMFNSEENSSFMKPLTTRAVDFFFF